MADLSASGGKKRRIYTMDIKVLIIDDEKPARDELHFILERLPEIGEISEANNASETLALLKKNEYDILFLDIHMPGINGIDAAKKNKQNG